MLVRASIVVPGAMYAAAFDARARHHQPTNRITISQALGTRGPGTRMSERDSGSFARHEVNRLARVFFMRVHATRDAKCRESTQPTSSAAGRV